MNRLFDQGNFDQTALAVQIAGDSSDEELML